MITLRAFRIASILAFMSTITPNAIGQNSRPIFEQDNFNHAGFIDIIQTSTVKYTSNQNFEEIPKNIVYRAVFIKIINGIGRDEAIHESDKSIILNLPSHNSFQFSMSNGSQIGGCPSAENSQLGNIDIQSLSRNYEETREAISKILDEHYQEVLQRLSPEARTRVMQDFQSYKGTTRISYSTINMMTLSQHSEAIALDMISYACDQEKSVSAELPPGPLLLKDTPMNWQPIESKPRS